MKAADRRYRVFLQTPTRTNTGGDPVDSWGPLDPLTRAPLADGSGEYGSLAWAAIEPATARAIERNLGGGIVGQAQYLVTLRDSWIAVGLRERIRWKHGDTWRTLAVRGRQLLAGRGGSDLVLACEELI